MIYTFSERFIFHRNCSVAFSSGCSCCFRLIHVHCQVASSCGKAEARKVPPSPPSPPPTTPTALAPFPPLLRGPYPKSDATPAKGEKSLLSLSPARSRKLCESCLGISLSWYSAFSGLRCLKCRLQSTNPKLGLPAHPRASVPCSGGV